MKKIIIISFLLLSIGILAYHYIYQDHRNIESEQTEFNTTPQKIRDAFSQDALKAEKKYLDKTIEVSGLISESNTKNLTLNDIVFCQFENTIEKSFKINSVIKIKGRCIGYDDLLEQVKLDQCTLIK